MVTYYRERVGDAEKGREGAYVFLCRILGPGIP